MEKIIQTAKEYNETIDLALTAERKRILKYLKGLQKGNPEASLAATIDLIEATSYQEVIR